MLLEAADSGCERARTTLLQPELLADSNQGKPDVISSGFYVSTDDIFDDSKWSDAVYFEEVGFDQDVSDAGLHSV
jgi:hypothetical protein